MIPASRLTRDLVPFHVDLHLGGENKIGKKKHTHTPHIQVAFDSHLRRSKKFSFESALKTKQVSGIISGSRFGVPWPISRLRLTKHFFQVH